MAANVAVQVRRADPADAEAIARINRDDLGYDHPVAQVRAQLDRAVASPSDLVLVAVHDGIVVGSVHAVDYHSLYAPQMVDVVGLAVGAEAQGLGAGRALMAGVEQWAHERGATAVRLVSNERRTEAHAFYEHVGYVSHKRQLNFHKEL